MTKPLSTKNSVMPKPDDRVSQSTAPCGGSLLVTVAVTPCASSTEKAARKRKPVRAGTSGRRPADSAAVIAYNPQPLPQFPIPVRHRQPWVPSADDAATFTSFPFVTQPPSGGPFADRQVEYFDFRPRRMT